MMKGIRLGRGGLEFEQDVNKNTMITITNPKSMIKYTIFLLDIEECIIELKREEN